MYRRTTQKFVPGNVTSLLRGIDSSAPAPRLDTKSLEYINVSVHPLYWLREQKIPGTGARARARQCHGGRQQEARIPLYHASGSLHRDYHHISARHQRLIFLPVRLSFSPSSLGVAFSESRIPLPCLLVAIRVSLPLTSVSSLARPVLLLWLQRAPVPRAALGFREMTICKLLRAAFLWPRCPRWRWKTPPEAVAWKMVCCIRNRVMRAETRWFVVEKNGENKIAF